MNPLRPKSKIWGTSPKGRGKFHRIDKLKFIYTKSYAILGVPSAT